MVPGEAGPPGDPSRTSAGGVHHWRGVADPADCARWRSMAEAALAAAATRMPAGPLEAAPWPCSLPLDALPDLLAELQHCLEAHAGIAAVLATALGSAALLGDQCYVRHQPAPAHRRGRQSPHAWHQDGALGFDFLAAGEPPYPAEALLPMQTCWMPLTPWGDTAPGLGWFEPPAPALLPPAVLNEEHLEVHLAGLGLTPRRRCPAVAAGDVLQFGGATVHHTHATASMQLDRTSIELRWLRADLRPSRRVARR